MSCLELTNPQSASNQTFEDCVVNVIKIIIENLTEKICEFLKKDKLDLSIVSEESKMNVVESIIILNVLLSRRFYFDTFI